MAQHKGYAIAMMMDVLSGVLTGSAFGAAVSGPYQFDKPSGCGQLMIAMDISAFQPLGQFNQRMEELRELASRAEDISTFEVIREVMVHWPKGADFLTLLWEVNVVRRTSRRMLASLLSSYLCFYQRSGSPVWHYDHKKVEQGFDKSKKKFILK